jgi:uncharacterized damage-inducible protein DinB
MKNLIDPILAELTHEMATTRRLLERAPDTKFGWKPHDKSMTLGRLTGHIAELPGWIATIVDKPGFDFAGGEYKPFAPTSTTDLLTTFDKHVAVAAEALKPLTDTALMESWRLTKQGQLIMEMPRIGVARTLLLNHIIHHRGQLSVYLRLLNVPLPSIYGPSADTPM